MDQISTYSNFNKANINIAYDDLVKDLNNLFKNADNYISQLLKDQNITTRKRKLSFIDALTYKFIYANIMTKYKQHSHHGGKRGDVRPYCEICEIFGHATEDCDEEQTY